MTLENWSEIMITCFRSDQYLFVSILYLISWIFFGNYILLNLFLAILIDSFENQKVDKYEEIGQEEETFQKQKTILIGDELMKDYENSQNKRKLSKFSQRQSHEKYMFPNHKNTKIKSNCNNSFFLFSKENKIRIAFYKAIKNIWFDRVILTLIVFSSLKLVLDGYILAQNTPTQLEISKISGYFNVFLTTMFIIEAMMKSIAFGFIIDDGSYLRDLWGNLDFFIVIVSIVDLSIPTNDLTYLKIFRLFRILRPLRFISHNKNMIIVVTTLMESVSGIINVVIVILLLWL